MKFDEFKRQIKAPLFDTVFARQALDGYGSDQYLAVQFSRWVAQGRLISLRRGLYAMPDSPVSPLTVANRLVEPSYVSGEYALSWYGLIPDAAWMVTSACRRTPYKPQWENEFGMFQYRQVKVFEGFKRLDIQGHPLLMAEMEKALLDYWYWQTGEWSTARHEAMRYQNGGQLNLEELQNLAQQFVSPRLSRAVASFWPVINAVVREEKEAVSA